MSLLSLNYESSLCVSVCQKSTQQLYQFSLHRYWALRFSCQILHSIALEFFFYFLFVYPSVINKNVSKPEHNNHAKYVNAWRSSSQDKDDRIDYFTFYPKKKHDFFHALLFYSKMSNDEKNNIEIRSVDNFVSIFFFLFFEWTFIGIFDATKKKQQQHFYYVVNITFMQPQIICSSVSTKFNSKSFYLYAIQVKTHIVF